MKYLSDRDYMLQALGLAGEAAEKSEVPVGALVVSPEGEVLGTGANAVEEKLTQAAHAEIEAIQAAGISIGTWRLQGCTLYVTLEPCMMCVSLAALSRIERIVYGAESPRFGFSLDKEAILGLYTRQIKSITSGVLADEAAKLLKDSFAKARKKQ